MKLNMFFQSSKLQLVFIFEHSLGKPRDTCQKVLSGFASARRLCNFGRILYSSAEKQIKSTFLMAMTWSILNCMLFRDFRRFD